MASYSLTKSAERDLGRIADYTIEKFGIEQARNYRDSLIEAFELISDNPRIGRESGIVRAGYRRFSHQKHQTFYTNTNEGVLIVHILGSQQDVTEEKF